MATVLTYTATPCISVGVTYEIPISAAALIKRGNLAAVRISVNPANWICCQIDRSTENETDEQDVFHGEDSGFPASQCLECNAHWS